MLQKELAALLGVSPAMVSRLAKRGMPVDSLERAERWRRRHLEPGRVKGARLDRSQASKAASPKPTPPARLPLAPEFVTDAQIEAAGDLVDGALRRGDWDVAKARIMQLRQLLARAAPDAGPRLAGRVWLALLDYMLHEDAGIRSAPDMGAMMTPGECGAVFFGPAHPWPAHAVMYWACDFEANSVLGWPHGEGDDSPGL